MSATLAEVPDLPYQWVRKSYEYRGCRDRSWNHRGADFTFKIPLLGLSIVVNTFNPSTAEAEGKPFSMDFVASLVDIVEFQDSQRYSKNLAQKKKKNSLVVLNLSGL